MERRLTTISQSLAMMGAKKKGDTIGGHTTKDERCVLLFVLIFVCACIGGYLSIAICLKERENKRKVAGNSRY